MATSGDDHRGGVSRMALATTGAGVCLWLGATALTVVEQGFVVGVLLWVWGVPALGMSLVGAALWCRRLLARRRHRSGEQPPVGLAPAAS